jgi:hypothetical protein
LGFDQIYGGGILKKLKVQFGTQQLLAIIIRLTTLMTVVSSFGSVAGVLGMFAALPENFREKLSASLWFFVLLLFIYIFLFLTFYKANLISSWISKENSVIVLNGDPESWVLPVLKFMGISLIISSLATFGYWLSKAFIVPDFSRTDEMWTSELVLQSIKLFGATILIMSPNWLIRFIKRFPK